MDFAHAYDPIRALSAAWRLLGRSALPLLLCGGLLLVMHLAFGLALPFASLMNHHHRHGGVLVMLLGVFGSVCLAAYLVVCWLSLGLAHAVEKTISSGTARVGDVFQTRDRYFEMVFGGLALFIVSVLALVPFVPIALFAHFLHEGLHVPAPLVAIGAFLSALAYFAAYLYVILGVSLWRQAIAVEGLGPIAAIGRSWRLANGHRLRLALYWIVMSLVTFVGFWGGLLLCCIGVVPGLFVSVTLVQVAQLESYFALVRADDYARSWLAAAAAAPAAPLNATIG